MAVTLKDVAGLAGVDIAAVSRTLRGDPRAGELREETCERILRCAKELGYHRNMSASTIRMGYNASTVSLIYSPGMLGFQSHLFQIISLANSKGLGVRPVTDEDLDGLFAELEANQIRYVLCSSEHVDRREKIAEFCAGTGRRVVFLGADPVVGRPSIQVSFDYYGGMRMLVRHLVRLGHRRIALYCGPHAHECPRLLHQGFLDEIAGSEGASGFTSCEEYSADELLRLIRQSRATAVRHSVTRAAPSAERTV